MQDHHSTNESFDIIVIGGGHAGCEAAITTAKLGFSTALFTINLDRIAWQPCNPAVGGPAKSQLVHEVDALGGIIGKLADETAIQKRILLWSFSSIGCKYIKCCNTLRSKKYN